ncbi:MAG: hypothetical protein SFU27_04935 [Thermonemataceae bacterium]|nr:hypothetical protein [Thermonemataceae bacterium]
MKALYLFIFYCFVQEIFAQNIPVKIIKEKSKVTGKENEWKIAGKDAVVVRDSGTRYTQIYIRSTQEILYGNTCAEQASKKMRVEFIIIPKDIGFGMKLRNIFGTNLQGHLKAFFRNGFFWRKRLKKKIQRCREMTGDYIR